MSSAAAQQKGMESSKDANFLEEIRPEIHVCQWQQQPAAGGNLHSFIYGIHDAKNS